MPCLLAAALLLPAAARATDGVREINQACARHGCFPGDAAGFPVLINAPGSYRLTGSLDLLERPMADENTTAILVLADDVTIDLNGFAILGPTRCPDPWTFPTSCPPTSTGGAIGIDATLRRRTSVHGGRVIGFPSGGVRLGALSRAHDLEVAQIAGQGITVGAASLVARCRVSFTGGSAIEALSQSLVVDSAVQYTVGFGISTFLDSMVARSQVSQGRSDGIDALDANVIHGGVVVGTTNIGIDARNDSLVLENVIAGSSGAGIALGAGSGFGENVLSDVGGAPGVAAALDCNVLNGAASCPP